MSQFPRFFKSALWFTFSCDPHGSASVGEVQLLVGLAFEHGRQQNPSLSCLLLCTSDAQSMSAVLSIPNKNQLPAMLRCEGRSLSRDAVEGEAERMTVQLTELSTGKRSTREK